MTRIAFSQLLSQPRRYIAVLLAIVIGTTFLAASFLVGSSTRATLREMLTASYATSDLVVEPSQEQWDRDSAAAENAMIEAAGITAQTSPLTSVDGVAGVGVTAPDMANISRPREGDITTFVFPIPTDVSLASTTLEEGTFPEPGDETGIAVDSTTAQRYGLSVGDTFELNAKGGSAMETTVRGITRPSNDPSFGSYPQVWVQWPLYFALDTFPTGVEELALQALHIRVADDARLDTTAQNITTYFADQGVEVDVLTPDDIIENQLSSESETIDPVTALIAAFAVIALAVTGLVIANTFQVLVAQRTRDLALLRSIGATTSQVRRSVFIEAFLIGVIGSVLGVGAAIALVAGIILLIQRKEQFAAVAFAMDTLPMILTIIVGVLLTVIAAIRPALAATRVAPLEAMRPRKEITASSKTGIIRIVVGALLTIGGTTAMLVGAFTDAFVLSLAGGMFSFLGVLLLAGMFVPLAVRAVSLLARPLGVPGTLAGVNAVRHRSRTAATATALLVGTTLVTLFLTGGRTAQIEIDQTLATEYPIDIFVTAQEDPETAAQDLLKQNYVTSAIVLEPVGTTAKGTQIFAAPAEDLRTALAAAGPESVDRIGTEGTLLAEGWTPDTVAITRGDGTEVSLERIPVQDTTGTIFLTREEAERQGLTVDPHLPSTILVDLDDSVTSNQLRGIVTDLNAVAQKYGGSVTGGGAPERSIYDSIIDAMLLIVVALLAVSVLIALIGVANTLSLSVIERTRENALLRALGLTKSGMRMMIAIEAMLIAGVSALLGCALGVFYGWAGSQVLLGELVGTTISVHVPWLEVAGVLGVAIVAGLLASIAPTRRATRLSPVEGLAAI